MQNIFQKKIQQLEELQKRLQDSQCMQESLNNYVKATLQSNLETFQRYYPAICEMFSDFNLKNYRLVCFRDSEPNVLNLKTGTLLYQNDPYEDTHEQVKAWASGQSTIRMRYDPELYQDNFCQFSFICCNRLAQKVKDLTSDVEPFKEIPQAVPNVILIGGGLGFPVSEIYSHTAAVNFFYIEPDIELFYCSLCLFDWKPVLEFIASSGYDLRFIIGKTPEDTLKSLESFYLDDYAYVLGYQAILQHYSSPECNEILKLLKLRSDRVAVLGGQFDDMMFGLANELCNLREYPVLSADPFKGKFKDFPVIVVGNGPSLDQDLPEIKIRADRSLIIACGTAFNALVKYGIEPDIYVALERISSVADSLNELGSNEVFEKTLCLTPDLVHDLTLQKFSRRMIFFKVGENLLKYLPDSCIPEFRKYLFCECLGPLVSNCGLSLALSLGFTDVWLCGIDCGAVSGESHSHSRFSTYYDADGKLLPKYRGMTLDNMDKFTPGNFIDTVQTNYLFLNSIYFMECLLTYHTDAQVKNSSNGAKIRGTLPEHLTNAVFPKQNENVKAELLDLLKQSSCSFKISRDPVAYLTDQKVFLDISGKVLKMIGAGYRSATSREDFIVMFRKISLFLLNGSEAGRLARNLLKGTLSAMFSDIISLLYTISNEGQSVGLARELLSEVEIFLKGAQKIFPYLPRYIQGEHIQILGDLELLNSAD